MTKPIEIYKPLECGMYEVSNYYNIRTTPYKFFKGKKLITSENKAIPLPDITLSRRCVTMLQTGWGYNNVGMKKRVSKLFTEFERFEVKEYLEYLAKSENERER